MAIKTQIKYTKKFNAPKFKKGLSRQILKEVKSETSKFKRTGKLHRSIKVSDSANLISITSIMPYARIQNQGGYIPVTENSRKAFWALFYSTGKSLYKWMALSKKRSFKIKPKHYIKERKISNIIKRYFKKNLK